MCLIIRMLKMIQNTVDCIKRIEEETLVEQYTHESVY